MSAAPKEALELLTEAAADPSCDTLMQRCPANATDDELREMVRIRRAERATWRARE